MAAILISVKVNEDKLISIAQCVQECNFDYDDQMIIKTERMMLLLLNFDTNVPSPIEFIQFLLYLSDQTFDFSEIINECHSFVYVSFIGKKFVIIQILLILYKDN